ncbi:hypothetical protein [Polaromonas sp. DSR2-3-2]|uniref:hypothetical protein n=1 Tax=unclassified Polaromonas TaxID=2638319 RepID=UPI003CE94E0E
MKNKFLQIMLLVGMATSAQAGDIVVIGNPAAAALTKDQVADVFLGKSQAATPIDQAESAPIRAEFYKQATGRDMAQVKSTWSRLVFSGKGQAPKEVADSAAVKKAVVADPKAIGYVSKAAVDGSVKVIHSVD